MKEEEKTVRGEHIAFKQKVRWWWWQSLWEERMKGKQDKKRDSSSIFKSFFQVLPSRRKNLDHKHDRSWSASSKKFWNYSQFHCVFCIRSFSEKKTCPNLSAWLPSPWFRSISSLYSSILLLLTLDNKPNWNDWTHEKEMMQERERYSSLLIYVSKEIGRKRRKRREGMRKAWGRILSWLLYLVSRLHHQEEEGRVASSCLFLLPCLSLYFLSSSSFSRIRVQHTTHIQQTFLLMSLHSFPACHPHFIFFLLFPSFFFHVFPQ